MSDADTAVLYESKDHVATITINRPQKLNSVTAHSLREIEVAFDAALILGSRRDDLRERQQS